jgi:hypothetical protein
MTSLNEKQKTSLWLGILTIVAMGAFPPWKEIGPGGNPATYAPIFEPPVLVSKLAPEIDFSRLLLQCGLVGLVTGGMLATAAGASSQVASATKKEGESVAAKPEPAAKLQLAPKPEPAAKPQLAAKPEPAAKPQPAAKLAPQSKAKVRTLKFPDNLSIGEVLLESEDDPDFWESVGAASGIVTVPAGRSIQLEVCKDSDVQFSALKNLDPHAIQSLDLSGSAVKDADLDEIVHFNRLNEIDLSNTEISDKGIESIAKIHSLKRVWLDHSKVTDQALKILTALQELQKVSFVGTEITESALNEVKAEFPAQCQIVMASGKTT